MNSTTFQIIYDGDALSTHEMDVRDLAPALLALSDLLEEINGDTVKVTVNVKGSFKTGCFHIDFSVVQNILTQLVGLLNGENIVAVATIMQLTGFSGKDGYIGLVQFIRWLKGRTIKKIEKIGDNKSKVIVDNDSIEVEENLITAVTNVKVRQSLEVIITNPLSRSGIDSFKVVSDNDTSHPLEINKEEKDLYIAPKAKDEQIDDQVLEKNLQAIGISFVDGNKWRFSDGNSSFFAEVRDNGFIEKIQSNLVTFAKHDILKVKLRQKQYLTDTGIKTEYEVLEVLDHRRATKQLNLFADSSQGMDTTLILVMMTHKQFKKQIEFVSRPLKKPYRRY